LNSIHILTWLNTKNYIATHPNETIDQTDVEELKRISSYINLNDSFSMAIDSYDKWVIKMSFSTCRFCDSCGGNYPTYAGEGVKDKSQGRYSKYHDDCGGSKLYDDNNNANPQLCCSFD